MSNRGSDIAGHKEEHSAISRTNYLLAIAIDDYQYCPSLYNCTRDADKLIGLLTEKYQFEKTYITTLYNKEATEDRIIDALNVLVSKVKENDNLVIMYSGHGEYEKTIDEGYWIPVDGQPNQTADYISNSRITKYLKAIKAHHILLIVDSCFSGALFTNRKLNTSTNQNRLDHIASRWLLTSGRNEVVADGTPGDHSPFADNLLYFLDKNKDASLSISQLVQHVIEGVTYNANQTPRGEPLQNVGHKGGQFYFHIKGTTPAIQDPTIQPNKHINIEDDLQKSNKVSLKKVFIALGVLAVAIGLYFFLPNQQKQENHSIKPSFSAVTYDSLLQEGNKILQQTNPDKIALITAEQIFTKALAIAIKTSGIEAKKAKEGLYMSQLKLEELTAISEKSESPPIKPEKEIPTEERIWLSALQKNSEQAYRTYIRQYPKGTYAKEAQRAISKKYNYKVDLTTNLNIREKQLTVNIIGGKPPYDIKINYEGQIISKISKERKSTIDLSPLKRQAGKRILSVVVIDRNFVGKGAKTFID